MFWRVIEETGRRHGQLEDWGQPPSPHAGRGADVGFLEAPPADRREGGGLQLRKYVGDVGLVERRERKALLAEVVE